MLNPFLLRWLDMEGRVFVCQSCKQHFRLEMWVKPEPGSKVAEIMSGPGDSTLGNNINFCVTKVCFEIPLLCVKCTLTCFFPHCGWLRLTF